jgi:hypothetical protein
LNTLSRVIVKQVPRKYCKSFSTKVQKLQQQTAAENAEKQVELEEAGAFMFAFFSLGIA